MLVSRLFSGNMDSTAHGGQHLGHPTKVTTRVHAEEQIDRATTPIFSEGFVEALIARISRTPNLVL
jgi:hypothetical protein